jgi:hypothetical protein
VIGLDASVTAVWRTMVTCFHPDRWVSPGGHVEVCSRCSECRPATTTRFWRAAARVQVRVGDELLMFCKDGAKLYRRDPVRQ